MCFSHAKEHMLILYMGCMKFPTNRFVVKIRNLASEAKTKEVLDIFP
jgi:hypothetical protein